MDPLEIIATLTSLLFLILLIRQNIWCWIFGIFSSFLSVYLFIKVQLYSEAILYLFYGLFGIYGWVKWSDVGGNKIESFQKMPLIRHGGFLVLGSILAFGLGKIFDTYTDADKTYIDSSTTIFSLIATFLEAHKYVYAWIYWIIINGISVWLYYSKGLQIYAALMVIYFILSFVGLYSWEKEWKNRA